MVRRSAALLAVGIAALAVLLRAYFQICVVDSADFSQTVTIDGSPIKIERGSGGVFHIYGADDLDFARALGISPHQNDQLIRVAGILRGLTLCP